MNTHYASQSSSNSLIVEEGRVVSRQALPGGYWTLVLNAPQIAARAIPGQFVHLTCHPMLPLRRPISIQRVTPHTGHIELCYRVVGHGTTLLSQRHPTEMISILGPIGRGFQILPDRPKALMIGGGVGIPPLIFLAESIQNHNPDQQSLVLMGSESPFPFPVATSRFPVPGIDAEGAIPALEKLKIPSRLASLQGFQGCYLGYVTELARDWLAAQTEESLREIAIYACGPEPMLQATAQLAATYQLPCQLSLEAFMACGVGGCAGCVVPIHTPEGKKMKRVCVDGPVFSALEVYPERVNQSAG